MQTTHHAGKIAAIQQSFVPRIVASHLLLSRKQVSPSFTSPAHLVVRQKKSKLLLDSLHAWWRKMPRYPKIQTGRMVQLCTESVGRTLLLQCWRSGGGRHNAAEKALCAICLGNKNSYDLCQILSPKRPTQLRSFVISRIKEPETVRLYLGFYKLLFGDFSPMTIYAVSWPLSTCRY